MIEVLRPLRVRGLHLLRLLLVLLVSTGASAQDFRVTLLGTGDPIPRVDRFGPSILVQAGDKTLLFDAGRGATQRLVQLATVK